MSGLTDSVKKAMDQGQIKCPGCGTALQFDVTAAFKETTLTLALTVEEGHMLQATTLGGMLTNLDKLLSITAKQLGGNVQTLVKNIRCTDREIAIDFLIATIKPKQKLGK